MPESDQQELKPFDKLAWPLKIEAIEPFEYDMKDADGKKIFSFSTDDAAPDNPKYGFMLEIVRKANDCDGLLKLAEGMAISLEIGGIDRRVDALIAFRKLHPKEP